MPTKKIADDENGKPRWVRLPYDARQYSVPAGWIEGLRAHNAGYGSRQLLAEHGGPFAALSKLREFEQDGKPFALLFFSGSVEWGVEVELTDGQLGEVRPLAPEAALKVAKELAKARGYDIPTET